MTTQAFRHALPQLKRARAYKSGNRRVIEAHTACCPAHEDSSPSFSLALLDDGRILVHCQAGCGFAEILASLGLSAADGAPDRAMHYCAPVTPWLPLMHQCDAAENKLLEAAVSILRVSAQDVEGAQSELDNRLANPDAAVLSIIEAMQSINDVKAQAKLALRGGK